MGLDSLEFRELVNLITEADVDIRTIDVGWLPGRNQEEPDGAYGEYVILLVIGKDRPGLFEYLFEFEDNCLFQEGDGGRAESDGDVLALVLFRQFYDLEDY